MPTCPIDAAATHAFIARWSARTASKLSTAQSFVIELCALLGVAPPHPTPEQDYMFERPVTFSHGNGNGNGSTSAGRIDCYRRGHFVLEAKKLKVGAHTKGFDDGLLRARSLPTGEDRPPFVLVVDVGTVIEVYAKFSRSGGTYTPFPGPRSHRLLLADLAKPEVQQRLRRIWQDPDSLNPARISAQVTRDVAALLARLAKSLEGGAAKYETNQPKTHTHKALIAPKIVANYLTRCLFCMFAKDVELLPKGAFQTLLQTHKSDPATLQHMLRILWADMDKGGFSAALAKPVLHFNGKLFKGAAHGGYSLLLTPEQIDLLIEAARANWREVEPAIFGTLLERALDPAERHALGAHYTARAYVERLVLPTVIEPLRADWANAQAAALVLWIGFLQWHIRTQGNASVAEPVLHNYGNIECRDAVLAWDTQEPAYDDAGQLLTRWDGRTVKTHPSRASPCPTKPRRCPSGATWAPGRPCGRRPISLWGTRRSLAPPPCALPWATATCKPCTPPDPKCLKAPTL